MVSWSDAIDELIWLSATERRYWASPRLDHMRLKQVNSKAVLACRMNSLDEQMIEGVGSEHGGLHQSEIKTGNHGLDLAFR